MIFNIYYINFPKVYEIKMMLGGTLVLQKKEKEQSSNVGVESELDVSFGIGSKLFNIFKVDADGKAKASGSSSQKVLETFEAKTTKSIILNDVVNNCKSIKDFGNINEGELIRLDNISLTLENEPELRVVKLFTSNAFKGFAVPGANGIDINNLFNSMFKDYAYKLKGYVKDSTDEILIKIPLTFENEFESSYSVDDLLIGKVSIIGLYKGIIKLNDLRNSLEFFQEINNVSNMFHKQTNDDEIEDSEYHQPITKDYTPFTNIRDEKQYHYIDVLSIIQVVNIQK